ncbi:MAG: CBS domain-containing protein [Saprospiraceae bacterium]|nr:CBS domain-containing protein [Saprospiraceae bacterium]MCB9345786.1 CBS domain-containing protein [Lewinellaceae bacterium]
MISVQKLLEGKARNLTFFVTPDNMVIEALELMSEKNIGAVMVMDGNKLIGVFSEREYARKGIIRGRKAKSTSVIEVMRVNPPTVSPEMDIEDCMELFQEHKVRHLPVIQNEEVIGMISVGDLLNGILEEQKSHINFLEQYITR